MRHVSPVESLVAAVLKDNGDGLVMHVGERPYVLSPDGSSNLSERTADGGRHEGRAQRPAVAGRPGDARRHRRRRARDHLERRAGGQVPPRGRARRRRHLDRAAAPARRRTDCRSPRPDRGPGPFRRPGTAPGLGDLVAELAPRPRMAPNHPQTQPPPPPPRPAARSALAASRSDRRARAHPAADAPDGSRPRHVRRASCCRWRAARSAPRDRARAPRRTPQYLGIGRLLRTAAARGASSLYLMAEARPSIRIDDEILPLETEPPLGTAEVEALDPRTGARRQPRGAGRRAAAPSGCANCRTWAASAA